MVVKKINSLGPLGATVFATGAVKETGSKPSISLVPAELVLGAARAFDYGAMKYSAHNWRRGMPATKLYDALQRHLLAWNEGTDLDPESDLDHLDHVAACLGMLMQTIKDNRDLDDRYIKLDQE